MSIKVWFLCLIEYQATWVIIAKIILAEEHQ